jgi:hypothetical protein
MKEKEKAVELVDNFSNQTYKCQPYAGATYLEEEVGFEAGKKCALICVGEIIKEGYDNDMYQSRINYWQKVKTEIEKL